MKKEKVEWGNNPTGLIPEDELMELADDSVSGGGITVSSWACGATVALSIAVCPTFKCTSKC